MAAGAFVAGSAMTIPHSYTKVCGCSPQWTIGRGWDADDTPVPTMATKEADLLVIFIWLIWKSVRNFRPAAA